MSLLGVIAASRRRGGSSYHPDAQAYFDALAAAAVTMSADNKTAVNNLITGSVEDGNWSSIKALHLYAGPNAYAGSVIPVIGPTPTVVGTVSTGWTRTLGLVQPAAPSTNHIGTNIDSADASIFNGTADFCHGCFVTAAPSVATGTFYGGQLTGGKVAIINSGTELRVFQGGGISQFMLADVTAFTGYIGVNRTGSAKANVLVNDANANPTVTSVTPTAGNIFVFRRAANSAFNGATLGAWWGGHSLADHAAWRNRLVTFFAALA